ncbi:alpha/beta fold hydrolase [Enterococcus caccae]|uniref:AB hydrolase-1 domain-containing protein n=1 Tax=Enterococcus caccae ATCC BAA-1240 TaxID=1158612 RepID=R3WIY5_9ENTE|nr:alpha/beta hydrolase [Enterococcus caccae]EOL47801.1 hypothetical protein UC7_01051 [Enterococcus caccae ATCC BAA-1240]EOT65599.1 hypothetical protein I580_01355 [Enterococcus caccae ATCC BAA-1240]OJG27217.1 hypothetical protein RU98_GL002669 [Enterococcus caccae]
MPFLNVSGATIYFESKGHGPHILLIHAGIADSRMWENEFHSLAKQFHVTRFDLPGFGQSSFTGGTFSYTKLINKLLTHLSINQTHILAASFGGKIALNFVLEHPERCLRLALQSSAIGTWDFSQELQEYDEKEEQLLAQKRFEQAAELNYQTWILRDRNPESLDPKLKKLVIDMQMAAFTRPEPPFSVEEEASMPPIPDRLSQLKLPVLVIIGENDVPDFQNISEFFNQTIVHSEKMVIPNAAHLANLEAPELINQLLISFFHS